MPLEESLQTTHLTAHQVGCEPRKALVLTLRPAVFDRQVLALEKASFLQAMLEFAHSIAQPFGRRAMEKPDDRHRRLLRACRDRPRGCRAAEQRDELAPPHWIEMHLLPKQGTPWAAYRIGEDQVRD